MVKNKPNLDFDDDLGSDAELFGIALSTGGAGSASSPALVPEIEDVPLREMVELAYQVWASAESASSPMFAEFTIDYLEGRVWDVPPELISMMQYERNYWQPRYFRKRRLTTDSARIAALEAIVSAMHMAFCTLRAIKSRGSARKGWIRKARWWYNKMMISGGDIKILHPERRHASQKHGID